MKRNKYRKPVIAVLAAAAALLLLSACSGVIGGDTVVRISVPGMSGSGGRYIAPTSNSGYVVVLQKDKVYSLNSFSDKAYQELVNGNVYITNLPVGDYIFGVVLIDDNDTPDDTGDDNNLGLAIKEREIKKGFNDIVIEVGPGIDQFDINGVSFEDFFTPDGYTATFAEDTVILDINRLADGEIPDEVIYLPEVGQGVASGRIIINGVPTGGSSGSPWYVAVDEDGVAITITGALFPDDYAFNVILK